MAKKIRLMVPASCGWGYFNEVNLSAFKEKNGLKGDGRDMPEIDGWAVKEWEVANG